MRLQTLTSPTFISRVWLKNYKSIAACDVTLGPLVFLVGQNGSGKSNFLDALRFVGDALNTTLDHALRDRGGISEVRRRSGGHPNNFGIGVDFSLRDGSWGRYSFRIGAQPRGGFVVQEELCDLHEFTEKGFAHNYFRVREGQVETNVPIPPPSSSDRLYLVNAAGLPEFRSVYEALASMGFYNLNPDRLRDLQPPDADHLLKRDGSNVAGVWEQIDQYDPTYRRLIVEYLSKVVPGVRNVETATVGPRQTLQFRQQIAGAQHPWKFWATNMSDGTLRAFGVLVALFQLGAQQATEEGYKRVPLVGIEEPEVALHPAAAGVLLESIRHASQRTQIIVTSHSPDLLDSDEIQEYEIRAVIVNAGVTQIGRLDEAGREALRSHLYTPGELLRLNQLAPDPQTLTSPSISYEQLSLFETRSEP